MAKLQRLEFNYSYNQHFLLRFSSLTKYFPWWCFCVDQKAPGRAQPPAVVYHKKIKHKKQNPAAQERRAECSGPRDSPTAASPALMTRRRPTPLHRFPPLGFLLRKQRPGWPLTRDPLGFYLQRGSCRWHMVIPARRTCVCSEEECC